MKKFFTLLAAFAATMSMAAADVQLYFGDKPAEDGATYTTYYTMEAEEEFNGMMFRSWKQNSDLYLYGKIGTDVTIEVSSKQNVQVCSLDGNCNFIGEGAGMTSITKSGKLRVNGESLEIDKITDTMGDEDPAAMMEDITVVVTFYETNKPSEKTTVTVNMKNETNSIYSTNVTESYIRLGAGNVLNYRVDRPCTLNVYGITGSLAAKYQLESNGTVSLNNLPKGIYVYTDGTRKGKVIVR